MNCTLERRPPCATTTMSITDIADNSLHIHAMPNRPTMNVSLPTELEKFVRAQVATGRFSTASEVVREGLRLLEQAEQRRLLEKWLAEGLTRAERATLPPGMLDEFSGIVQGKVAEAMRDLELGKISDGPAAMARIKKRLGTRQRKSSG